MEQLAWALKSALRIFAYIFASTILALIISALSIVNLPQRRQNNPERKKKDDTNYQTKEDLVDSWSRDWARPRVDSQAESWSDFLARVDREAPQDANEDQEGVTNQHPAAPTNIHYDERLPPVELDAENHAFAIFLRRLAQDIDRIQLKFLDARPKQESWRDFLYRVEHGLPWTHGRALDAYAEAIELELKTAKELYGNALRSSYQSQTGNSLGQGAGAVELEDTSGGGRSTEVEDHRPVTEPPVLDYSSFELIILAQKELDKKLGTKDIAWRTDGMDFIIENDLLNNYNNHLLERLGDTSNQQESAFLYGLKRELQQDFEEVRLEMVDTATRHGKSGYALQELITGIREIVEKNNPAATIGLNAFSYYESYPIEFPTNAEEDGVEE